MTRTTRLLILAAALTLLLALVATATAAPPDCKKKDPGYPTCPTTTTVPPTTTTVAPGSLGAGFSCAEYALLNPSSDLQVLSWTLTDDPSDPSLELDLTSGVDACVDLLNEDAGSFLITVNSVEPVPKKNSTLYALIKDSHAGDHCGYAVDMPGAALNLNLVSDSAGVIKGIPAATLNVCGTGYSEADVVWNSGSGEWEVDDTTITADQNPTADPLALMLSITGKPGITANVTITYTAGG